MIPKGDKDRNYLKNWRPLTMLNTYYKIISGCITERLKPKLDIIISHSQKAYLPNRYIGEITRTTYDILQTAKERNLPGVLLLIDFEKCFDSISFKFIMKCLDFFNFGEDIKQWVELLIGDFYSCINHAGNISQRFRLERGVKQGDPLSGFLFILCAEILSLKIKYSKDISGFELGNIPNSLEQFADDLKVWLKAFENDKLTEENIRTVVSVLENFFKISGLKANIEKTHAVWFGSKCDSDTQLCPDLNLNWTKTFCALGTIFDNKLENMEQNFDIALAKVKKILNNWKHRYLTPFGKITVIKSLILSKLTHLVLILPSLDIRKLKNIEKKMYEFLWDGKPNQVAAKIAILPSNRGGLNMVSIPEFWKSLKVSWLRRLTFSESFWKYILEYNLLTLNVNMNNIFYAGNTYLSKLSEKITNPFWKEVIFSGSELLENSTFSDPNSFLLQPIIENSLFKYNRKNFTKIFFSGSQCIQVADFMSENSIHFCTLDEFNKKTKQNLSYLNFHSVKESIKSGLHKLNMNLGLSNIQCRPRQTLLSFLLLKQKIGCQHIYDIFMQKKFYKTSTSEIEAKWHKELNLIHSVETWNAYWRLYAKIKYFNNMKWLQYRILHHSLKTNHIVSKFLQNVTPECTFCLDKTETISHLFIKCSVSAEFWNAVKHFFEIQNISIQLKESLVLFGNPQQPTDSVTNMIYLFGKMFIWKCRYSKINPCLNGFKNFLKDNLEILYEIYDMKNNIVEFDTRWESVCREL